MPNALYNRIHHQMHHPRGPLTDDARRMQEHLTQPAPETSLRATGDGVELHTGPANESPVDPYYRPGNEKIWNAFRGAARPSQTVSSDERLISGMTFGPEDQKVRQADSVPLSKVEFRRGFSLTAEETGVRIAGSISGFVAGATLELTQKGVLLHTEELSESFSGGSHRIETHKDSEFGPGGGSFSISANGTFAGHFGEDFFANSSTKFDDLGNAVDHQVNEVNADGHIEVAGAVFKTILNHNDVKFIRPVDAQGAVRAAEWRAGDASHRSRSARAFSSFRGAFGGDSGTSLAEAARRVAQEAEKKLQAGDLWGAEATADHSMWLSANSEHKGRVFSEQAERGAREERRAWGSSGGW